MTLPTVKEGGASAAELRELEDKHIASVVKKQIDAGLRAVTDGEFRREWFHVDYLVNLGGVEERGAMQSTNQSKGGVMPPRLVVTEKVTHPQPIQVADFQYLESQIAAAGAANGQVTTKAAYPTLEPFFADIARVYQEELADLYAAGCRFVQLDDTNLAYLCDQGMRAEAEKRHGDANQLAKQYASLINAAISQRPKDMAIGIHLCRGNHRSQWFAQGGYEPVAEVLFKDLDVDVYFLEYDDARSGDFSPLRHLPAHKIVVLGVMSSKVPQLDDKEEIVKRLNEAAAFCPNGLKQLCLSHQCGFSSTMEGNDLSDEEQWAKIRLNVEIAKQVWGDDLSV
ncbi:hypothetical protein PG997_001400 [Apiospora hydei]|uniref:Cobalamin-independent methionine synthase MetE C-terminal/archaeal domain-containing protein n=1 Tax=Apiospora hydei TaxID=1337664 RepID=A0ABR1XDE2_9PEZI